MFRGCIRSHVRCRGALQSNSNFEKIPNVVMLGDETPFEDFAHKLRAIESDGRARTNAGVENSDDGKATQGFAQSRAGGDAVKPAGDGAARAGRVAELCGLGCLFCGDEGLDARIEAGLVAAGGVLVEHTLLHALVQD